MLGAYQDDDAVTVSMSERTLRTPSPPANSNQPRAIEVRSPG